MVRPMSKIRYSGLGMLPSLRLLARSIQTTGSPGVIVRSTTGVNSGELR